MKGTLLVFCFLILFSCDKDNSTPFIPEVKYGYLEIINDEAAYDAAIKNGVTVTYFHKTNCIPCKNQRPALEELAGDLTGKIAKARIIEVNGDLNNSRVTNDNVKGYPTIIFKKNGKEIERLEGEGHEKFVLRFKLEALF
jgi:thioredoxin 1